MRSPCFSCQHIRQNKYAEPCASCEKPYYYDQEVTRNQEVAHHGGGGAPDIEGMYTYVDEENEEGEDEMETPESKISFRGISQMIDSVNDIVIKLGKNQTKQEAKMEKKEKVCKECEKTKPLEEFYPHKDYKDGHENVCRICKYKQTSENRKKRKAEKKAAKEEPETKVCSKCNTEKTISEFYAKKGTADGRDGYCRSCKDEYNRAYRAKQKRKKNGMVVHADLREKGAAERIVRNAQESVENEIREAVVVLARYFDDIQLTRRS